MSRSRAWVFTLNNYTDEEQAKVRAMGAQYVIFGREVGDNGTPHLQGYAWFKNARAMTSLKKKLPRAHWEKRLGSHEQARDYCKKEKDYEEIGSEPEQNGGDGIQARIAKNKRILECTLGELVESGEITMNQVPVLKKAKLIIEQEKAAEGSENVRGIWIYGPPGVGKSHYAREKYGESLYMKSQNKWFDGYLGEENILIDDLDEGAKCLAHHIKIWADKYPCPGEVKNGHVNLRHKHLIVTSNYKPEELWEGVMCEAIRRRFKFVPMLPQHIE